MKVWTAILLSAPIALGLAAWSVRPSKAPPSVMIARPVEVVSEPQPGTRIEVPPAETVDEERIRRKIEREKAHERLVGDYELRIRQLIASIDWARAESRIRFPVEHDMIAAEFDRAVERLQE